MGLRRSAHQGSATLGGGSTGTDGSETWFYCRWCQQRITLERLGEPCPLYPFPTYTLEPLLARLGGLGIPVVIRVDPLRPEACFTVLLHGIRLPDTHQPFQVLVDALGRLLADQPTTPLVELVKRLCTAQLRPASGASPRAAEGSPFSTAQEQEEI